MTAVSTLSRARLVPVVELPPYEFASPGRPASTTEDYATPASSEAYWRSCLADSGIVRLDPLRPGSWFVPVDRLLDPKSITAYLRGVLASAGGLEGLRDEDARGHLSGGIALFDGDDLLAEPGCCGDLADLAEWTTAAGHRGPAWSILWNGHPWLSVRYDADRLTLSRPHESAEPVAGWLVEPEALIDAIGVARLAVEQFASRLADALAEVIETEAEEIARRLAGLT